MRTYTVMVDVTVRVAVDVPANSNIEALLAAEELPRGGWSALISDRRDLGVPDRVRFVGAFPKVAT